MQKQQLLHDERYHKDIWLLAVSNRVKHMVLHFAKYNGQIFYAQHINNRDALTRGIVDSFIIAISTANILNIKISDKVIAEDFQLCVDLQDLGKCLYEKYKASRKEEDEHWFAREYSVVLAGMAKACESIDHLEDYPYRKELEKNLISLIIILLMYCYKNNLNIAEEIESRLLHSEKKSIFFDAFESSTKGIH